MKKVIFIILYAFLFFREDFAESYIQVKNDYIIAYMKYEWVTYDLYCFIKHFSYKYNLPPLLVCAVINRESKGKKYERGGDGEYGYMQPLAEHFIKKNIPHKLRFEPEYNFDIGCGYLAKAMKRSNRDIQTALRLYNQELNGKIKKI